MKNFYLLRNWTNKALNFVFFFFKKKKTHMTSLPLVLELIQDKL